MVAGEETFAAVTLAPFRGDLADVTGFVHGLIDPVSRERIPIVGATVRVMPLVDGVLPPELDPGHLPGTTDPDQVAFTDARGHYRHDGSPHCGGHH